MIVSEERRSKCTNGDGSECGELAVRIAVEIPTADEATGRTFDPYSYEYRELVQTAQSMLRRLRDEVDASLRRLGGMS